MHMNQSMVVVVLRILVFFVFVFFVVIVFWFMFVVVAGMVVIAVGMALFLTKARGTFVVIMMTTPKVSLGTVTARRGNGQSFENKHVLLGSRTIVSVMVGFDNGNDIEPTMDFIPILSFQLKVQNIRVLGMKNHAMQLA